jgi:hypothetical protein
VADALDRLKAALADRYAIERAISGWMTTVYVAENAFVSMAIRRGDTR